MLKDTFEKVNKYRTNVQEMLQIMAAVYYRIIKFADNYTNTKPVFMPESIESTMLHIQLSGNSAMYYKDARQSNKLISFDIDKLGTADHASIDQIFAVVAHIDTELNEIFRQITAIYAEEASKVIEEFKDSALPDLM